MSVDTRKSRFASAVGAELGLIVGFITVVTFFSVGKTWMVNLENLPWLAIMFIWLFGVMVWCAFGVVRHAEALAERFGEPGRVESWRGSSLGPTLSVSGVSRFVPV